MLLIFIINNLTLILPVTLSSIEDRALQATGIETSAVIKPIISFNRIDSDNSI